MDYFDQKLGFIKESFIRLTFFNIS